MPEIHVAPARPADADDLVAANIASRAYHAPFARPFTDRDGFDAWYGRMLTGPNIGFIARAAADGSIVGVVNITEIVWGGFRSAYLGYYGMAAHAGMGLMTTAVETVCRIAFDDLGLHRLEANIQPDNKASTGADRAGRFREGRLFPPISEDRRRMARSPALGTPCRSSG